MHAGTIAALMAIARTEGVGALYAGVWLTWVKQVGRMHASLHQKPPTSLQSKPFLGSKRFHNAPGECRQSASQGRENWEALQAC